MDVVQESRRQRIRRVGLVAGPVLGLGCLALLPGAGVGTDGADAALTFAGRATLALMVWMATWWLSEAIDVAATALLPLVVLPVATAGAFDTPGAALDAAARPYANPLIALFLGGFLLALAMERWNLHRRLALLTLRCVGTRPRRMIGGFMLVSAVLSMWVSNTATTVMMLPIALSVTALVGDPAGANGDGGRDHFALCLMLGVAYAASIGGVGTLIGTPPNLLLAGFVRTTYGVEIGFARWLLVGLPFVAVFLPVAWLVLTRFVYPVRAVPIEGGGTLIRRELRSLGRPGRGEVATLLVFCATAAAWITRPLLADLALPSGVRPLAGLSDAGIAIGAALLLFVLPVRLRPLAGVLDWETARRVPWGILILFGGGLSLAGAISRHGVAEFLGRQADALGGLPTVLIVLAVTAGVIFLTELTSNTATTATLLPVLAGVAPALGLDPMLLIVPAAIAASCAFMMPVATPPNAIVFGSGHVTIPQMCRAGLWLNVIGTLLVTALAWWAVSGLDPG